MNTRRSFCHLPYIWRTLCRVTENIFQRWVDPFPMAQLHWLGRKVFEICHFLWYGFLLGLPLIIIVWLWGLYIIIAIGYIRDFYIEFAYYFYAFER